MRVIVTRPESEAHGQVAGLRQVGLDAVALPLIAVSGPPDAQAVRAAWERLGSFDAAMFVSSNAVHYFYASKPAEALAFTAQAAIKTRAFVTGPGSYGALIKAQAEPAFIDAPALGGAQFDSEALWAVVRSQVGTGFRLLIVRGLVRGQMSEPGHSAEAPSDEGSGRDWLAQQVRAAGGTVEFVVAYQRNTPVWSAAQQALAAQAACDGSVWLLSSSEAVANLCTLCPQQSWQAARAVATHPRIAQAATAAGFGVVRTSSPVLADLVASIESLQ
jgi:uroporphyrinogen-III synthase